jgi:two-component system CheB/CheR fusion protein
MILAQTGRDLMVNHTPSHARLREAAFDSDTDPQIVLDANETLVTMNSPARERFGLANRDVGRPFQDLELSFRPVELRGSVDQAMREQRTVTIKDVQWGMDGEGRYFDIAISPLRDEDDSVLGTRIAFQDVSAYRLLQLEQQHSKQELETAYEELQSTNEELETMNEELQSTNEELQTMNDELRTRSTELNSANSFLESVFASLRSAVVVIDKEYKVLVWNDRASDLWGVRPDEAEGTHFLGLDIGLPVGDLRQPIKTVLNDGAMQHEAIVPAVNRRGKTIECRVTLTPLLGHEQQTAGVILMMEERKNSD